MMARGSGSYWNISRQPFDLGVADRRAVGARPPRSGTDLPGSAWRSSVIDSALGSTLTSATIA